ncbi:TBC1 domain family member 23 [Lycorma delicatula]|uniref:TBC1 domain family member 23 n=1 Tax=Lycorma delicatula TaxID=130591 RepID=UPI003F50EB22
MATVEDDSTWIADLQSALGVTGRCDSETVYNICQGQSVPEALRPNVWRACLDVNGSANQIMFNEIFDLPEQNILREDCQQFVAKLGNDDEDKLSVLSDLESIVTYHRKSLGPEVKYERGNGWIELLLPLIALKLPRSDTCRLFQAVSNRYIPCNANAFHLFRLLLLYHDPQLCSFLDTRRITPDLYTGPWFQSLFAGTCKLNVTTAMWDLYFQQADAFFVLFLALVMVVNAREQVLSMQEDAKNNIAEFLTMLPAGLELEDVPDFCSLAQYYAAKTPSSFREEMKDSFFSRNSTDFKLSLSQALCLPVSASELIENIALEDGPSDSVRFFLVDCRPADQYNAGHLPTAFHLDCNLMLQEPVAFSTAVQGLLSAQRQALAAGSNAGGEHLCFLGCGDLDDDQYTHMVVASFLQKHTQYVSLLTGGYQAIHRYLGESTHDSLTDHDPHACLVCVAEKSNNVSPTAQLNGSASSSSTDLFGKIGAAVKLKSAEVKGKLMEYIVNPGASSGVDRHVSSSDKLGKPYRNITPVFSIDDEQDPTDLRSESHDQDQTETVSISSRLKQPDVIASFKCQEVTINNCTFNSYLVVSASHIYVLREVPKVKDKARLVVKRSLSSIAKITCKKKHPELITFQYGGAQGDGLIISDYDRFIIPEAGNATDVISKQILKCLKNNEGDSPSPSSAS